ncbi:MAG: hypothetical protein AAGF77_04770 [Bacteroidota bacterium]
MKKLVLYSVLFLLVSGLHSCTLDSEENFRFVPLSITEVEVPENFVLNRTHSIEVTFIRPDDCTFFEGFDPVEQAAGTWFITAIGSAINESDCNTTADTITTTFEITVSLNQPYRLNFYTGADSDGNASYLEYEIPVIEN